jgi:putative thioredoxin
MSQQTPPPSLRGAIDLSALRAPAPSATAGRPPEADGGIPAGLVVEATDRTLESVLDRSLQVPVVLVLWSQQYPQTRDGLDAVVRVASGLGGRVLVASADLSTSPVIAQAFRPLLEQAFGQFAIPATVAFLKGQPLPMFHGVIPDEQIRPVLDEVVQAAAANGVTGRVDLGAGEGVDEAGAAGDGTGNDVDEALPPLIQAAYDAIDRGDLAAARAAYEQAIAQNPKDAEAKLGLAQVGLMERTAGTDAAQARAAAAAEPENVDAQIAVADLDVYGGHVEDAFLRLIDTVRVTSGADRDRVRTHLLELFEVVGAQDERVRKARTSLMNALY